MDLKYGMKGSEVQNLQLKLIAAAITHDRPDFNLPKYGADGDFGSETLQAVKNFQASVGLAPDGVAGFYTLSALDAVIEANKGQIDFNTTPVSSKTGNVATMPKLKKDKTTAAVMPGSSTSVSTGASASQIDWKLIGIGAAIIFGMMMFMDDK